MHSTHTPDAVSHTWPSGSQSAWTEHGDSPATHELSTHCSPAEQWASVRHSTHTPDAASQTGVAPEHWAFVVQVLAVTHSLSAQTVPGSHWSEVRHSTHVPDAVSHTWSLAAQSPAVPQGMSSGTQEPEEQTWPETQPPSVTHSTHTPAPVSQYGVAPEHWASDVHAFAVLHSLSAHT
jgi:hypothetical protein